MASFNALRSSPSDGFFQVAKHETFERRGDDLHMNAKVGPLGFGNETKGFWFIGRSRYFFGFWIWSRWYLDNFGYMSRIYVTCLTCFVASQKRRNGQFVGKWMVFSTWGSNPPNFQSPGTHHGTIGLLFNGISWRYQQIIDGSRDTELFWTSNWWKWTPLPLIFMQWHHKKLVSSLTFEAVWIYCLVTKQKRVLKAIHVVIYSLSLVILWHGIPKLQF